MPIYPIDQQSNTDQFGRNVAHAVRSVLAAWDVYHAPWIIIVTRPNVRTVRIESYWDSKNTPPKKHIMPMDAVFTEQSSLRPITQLTDVNVLALARALKNRFARMAERVRKP